MLKQSMNPDIKRECTQPPSGGCVLKQQGLSNLTAKGIQPPSGGCVLKPFFEQRFNHNSSPAAFRRLCVETCLPR